jgi:hypothetical protein
MAATRIFDFSWPVHEAGYKWGECVPGTYDPEEEGWYWPLVPVDPHGCARRYEPLRQHGALFRTFAEVDTNLWASKGIVAFANTYGLLGRPPAGYRLQASKELKAPGSLIDDWDLVWVWWKAIREMRDLVQLWDLLRARDHTQLKYYVRWEGDKVVYDNHPELPPGSLVSRDGLRSVWVIASREERQDWFEYFTPGDVITPAYYHLMASINVWLQGLADPRLRWDEKQGRPVSKIVPSSLLGALWLQFHQAVAGQKDYRQCAVCQSWFEISPRVNRASRLYCGDACRSQAYRDRKKVGQQGHEEG